MMLLQAQWRNYSPYVLILRTIGKAVYFYSWGGGFECMHI
jgi:hypothetical protein